MIGLVEAVEQLSGRIPSGAENQPSPKQARLLNAVLCAMDALTLLSDPASGGMPAKDVQAWLELAELRDRLLAGELI